MSNVTRVKCNCLPRIGDKTKKGCRKKGKGLEYILDSDLPAFLSDYQDETISRHVPPTPMEELAKPNFPIVKEERKGEEMGATPPRAYRINETLLPTKGEDEVSPISPLRPILKTEE